MKHETRHTGHTRPRSNGHGQSIHTLLLLLALLAGGLTGCEPKVLTPVIEQTPYLAFPQGIEQLVSFDLQRFSGREYFPRIRAELLESDAYGPMLSQLSEEVGFDPLQKIHRVVVASRGGVDPRVPAKNLMIVVKGEFQNPEPTLERFRNWLGLEYLINPPTFQKSVSAAGEIPIYQLSAQSQYNENIVYDLNLAFPSETLMLFSLNKALFEEMLSVIGGQVEGLQKDRAWIELLNRPDIGATAWGTGTLTPALLQRIQPVVRPLALEPNARYFFNMTAADDFRAELGLVSDSIEKAEQVSQRVKAGVQGLVQQMQAVAPIAPRLAAIPQNIRVLTELQVTRISLRVTNADYRAIIREIEALQTQAVPTPTATPAPAGAAEQEPRPGNPPERPRQTPQRQQN